MHEENYFSHCSDRYAQYRPRYTSELFEHLFSLAPSRKCAWDAACGTGQAAIHLANHFDQVFATDVSRQQIEHAVVHPKIVYRVCPSEKTEIESDSVDLITVAQAIHWFDLGLFYQEAKRVLKNRGVIAFWMYRLCKIEPGIDHVIRHYYEIVRPYWPPERRWIEIHYEGLPFPFEELSAKQKFTMGTNWGLEQLLGYFETWSATQSYKMQRGSSPLLLIAKELEKEWGTEAKRAIEWPLVVRIGRLAGKSSR